MGYSSVGSYKVARQAPGRVASRSSRHVKNEGSCKVLHMVARSRQIHENKARSCSQCQAVRYQLPVVAPLYPWCWPEKPWQHIHADFAGPFQGTMFLVTVDAHLKWPEVSMMSSTTVSKTMDVLRQMFAAYGLPHQIVSDNGPQFISDDFATFTKMNGIKHIRSAPYHPASNGLAERFIQALKASLKDGRPLFQRLQFLTEREKNITGREKVISIPMLNYCNNS